MNVAVDAGSDRLDEARALRPLFDGQRLRVARELRGLTQAQLGARAGGISGAAVSQFEQGHARPSARTLGELARALESPPAFFMSDTRTDSLDTPAFFRSLRSTTAAKRRSARAFAEVVRLFVLALERQVEFPHLDIPAIPASPEAPRERIEEIAAQVRLQWGCGLVDPVPDVVSLIERHGAVVVRVQFDVPALDAFSIPYEDRPIIILCADKGKKDRSRFDAAHELGHLVMHGPSTPEEQLKAVERQAHQFAAAFLMPETGIRSELPAVADWSELVWLKKRWGTSIAALLYRARTLGTMSELDYRRATKAMSARGWRVDEPGDLGNPESPTVLDRAIRLVLDAGIMWSDLSRETGVGPEDLQRIADAAAPTRPRVFV
jgi:Zn-dependent peptidase ImmA (M78 family)/transcriptional regulator with XRE-family HTH domain